MRVHIYSQEVEGLEREGVQLVSKEDERGKRHYGVRFWLKSHACLHRTPEDDDRSAVTFWIPNEERFSAIDLALLFDRAYDLCLEARALMRRAAEQAERTEKLREMSRPDPKMGEAR